jgi:hypothetical protein
MANHRILDIALRLLPQPALPQASTLWARSLRPDYTLIPRQHNQVIGSVHSTRNRFNAQLHPPSRLSDLHDCAVLGKPFV